MVLAMPHRSFNMSLQVAHNNKGRCQSWNPLFSSHACHIKTQTKVFESRDSNTLPISCTLEDFASEPKSCQLQMLRPNKMQLSQHYEALSAFARSDPFNAFSHQQVSKTHLKSEARHAVSLLQCCIEFPKTKLISDDYTHIEHEPETITTPADSG